MVTGSRRRGWRSAREHCYSTTTKRKHHAPMLSWTMTRKATKQTAAAAEAAMAQARGK
jgi:hypothetical protein